MQIVFRRENMFRLDWGSFKMILFGKIQCHNTSKRVVFSSEAKFIKTWTSTCDVY